MVTVLMRDKDCVQIRRLNVQGFQALFDAPGTDSRVNEKPDAAHFDKNCVSSTSTGQNM